MIKCLSVIRDELDRIDEKFQKEKEERERKEEEERRKERELEEEKAQKEKLEEERKAMATSLNKDSPNLSQRTHISKIAGVRMQEICKL